MRTYDVIALLRAWAKVKSPRRAAAPTADEQQRFDAMLVAFGADGSREATTLWILSDTVRWLDRELRSPFDGMMEAPQGVVDLYQRYGQDLREKVAELRRITEEMVREGGARAFGIDPLATISDEDLRAAGFDPGPEPAPVIDDWDL